MMKYIIWSIFLISMMCGELSSGIAQTPKEWEDFTSAEGKAVFVKSNIYGGDFERAAILRGKVRNITNIAIRDIYVVWLIYDEKGDLIPPRQTNSGPLYIHSFYSYKIDYLDAKTTEDFEITLDLYRKFSSGLVPKIRDSLFRGRYKVELYLKQK
jgi:hypothetical protein